MDRKHIVSFIEGSFLKPLLLQDGVTDISYNGDSIYYVDNKYGRKKSDVSISNEIVRDFIRQIANLCEKQFSFQNPILDVSVGKYRLNAVHQSISKRNNEEVINFSIRIASTTPKIFSGCNFFEPGVEELLSILLKSKVSIVLGGVTSSGKTELQKYLISCMSEHTRIIVIDNILELDSIQTSTSLDVNMWQFDEKNLNLSIKMLIKNALRSNPDWLIIAESRGEEMLDVLNSSLTGHPVITTIHSYDLSSMPLRIARMAMIANGKINLDETLMDLEYHMRFYIYLKKISLEEGSIRRYISDIGFLNHGIVESIYKFDGCKARYFTLPNEAIRCLDLTGISPLFKELFVDGKK